MDVTRFFVREAFDLLVTNENLVLHSASPRGTGSRMRPILFDVAAFNQTISQQCLLRILWRLCSNDDAIARVKVSAWS